MCSRAVWIEDGKIIRDGKAKDICAEYQNKMSSSPEIIANLAEAGVAESQYELAIMYRDGTNFGKSEELYKEWMKKAADQGHTLAQVEYANYILEHKDDNKISDAICLYQSAANKGNNEARVKLSSLKSFLEKDDFREEIKKILLKMANQGDPLNQFKCADFLLKTAWTNDDRVEAFNWFVKSADNGYPNAIHQMALMKKDGIGTTKNYEEMEMLLRKSSDLGFIPSIILLADTYFQGKLIPKNDKCAFEYYIKGAKLGNGWCQYQTAIMYRDGIGVKKDVNESEKWFEKFSHSNTVWDEMWAVDWARTQNDYDSSLISRLYYTISTYSGNTLPIANVMNIIISNSDLNRERYEDLMHSMEFLANNGNIDAMRRLGNFYYDGVGVKKDYFAAITWYEKAASLGDQWCRSRLGEMYRDGKGTQPNIEKATEWFYKASIMGNAGAMSNIIYMYSSGTLERDPFYDDCIDILKNMANNGNIDAMRRLGNFYYDGVGVKKDYFAAITWYEKAASLGDQWCRSRLGEMYRDGKGTQPNIEKATEWFMQ